MKTTIIKSIISPYRRSVILDQFIHYVLITVFIICCLLLSLFLFSQVFIISQIDVVFTVTSLISILLISGHFLVKNKRYIFGNYLLNTIRLLNESNQQYKNKLFNLYDIDSKAEKSELERDYLKNKLDSIQLKFNRLINKRLTIATTFIVLSSVVLYGMNQNFNSYLDLLFLSKQEQNKYTLNLYSDDLVLLTDSTSVLSFSSNIPDINFLNLVIRDLNGLEVKQTINHQKNQFEFKYDYIKNGQIFLETESTLFGKIQSNSINFKFIQPLKLVSHSVAIDYPRYTGRKREFVKNINDISLLKGSLLSWDIDVNKTIESIHSNFKLSDSLSHVFNKRIYRTAQFEVDILDSDSLQLHFQSEPIKVTTDQKPVIVLRIPSTDINIAELNPVQFFLAGFDDFGFSKVVLHYYYENPLLGFKSEWKNTVVLNKQPSVFQKQITWSIDNIGVFPGMDIYYKFVAYDNNSVSGFQQAETQIQKIHLLSLDELYAQLGKKQEEIKQQISQNMSERQSIIEKLEMLNRKLKQKGQLSFHERKQLEQLLNKLKDLNKQLDQSKQDLSELSQKAEQENLFTDEMTNKFNEIKELLEKMNLMKKMDIKPSDLNKMKDNQIQQELDKITEKEKEMKNQMDRLKALLEKLKKEQEADYAIKKIQEFRNQQEKINEMTEKNKSRSDQEQKKLADQVKQMELKETEDSVFKKAQDELKQQNVSDRMKKTAEEKSAKEKRDEIAKDLDQLQKSLQEQVKKQKEEEKKELLAEIQDNQDKLLYLSFSQEDLAKSAKNISVYSDQYRAIAYDQKIISQRILFLMNRLNDISKQSFLFNPAIINVLESARETSDKLIANLEQRQNQRAYTDQTMVISNLNQSILMLQNNKNSMNNASSALGAEEFRKQMEQMAQGQEAINGKTQSLWDMLRQQSGSQSDQLSKQSRLKGQKGQGEGQQSGSGQSGKQSGSGELGGEQKSLSEQLNDLMDQVGEGAQGAGSGRLGEMLKEMKKISEELQADRLNEELIKRQKKLLQKMLDSARSGREKDKSKKNREKEMAKEFEIKEIKDLDRFLGQGELNLQEQFEKAMSKSYNENIKSQIRNYFNNLINAQSDSLNVQNQK